MGVRARVAVFLALLVGCGTDEPEIGPKCQALIDLCHEAEEAGVAGAVECHDYGHEGDETVCEQQTEACETTCASTT